MKKIEKATRAESSSVLQTNKIKIAGCLAAEPAGMVAGISDIVLNVQSGWECRRPQPHRLIKVDNKIKIQK